MTIPTTIALTPTSTVRRQGSMILIDDDGGCLRIEAGVEPELLDQLIEAIEAAARLADSEGEQP